MALGALPARASWQDEALRHDRLACPLAPTSSVDKLPPAPQCPASQLCKLGERGRRAAQQSAAAQEDRSRGERGAGRTKEEAMPSCQPKALSRQCHHRSHFGSRHTLGCAFLQTFSVLGSSAAGCRSRGAKPRGVPSPREMHWLSARSAARDACCAERRLLGAKKCGLAASRPPSARRPALMSRRDRCQAAR